MPLLVSKVGHKWIDLCIQGIILNLHLITFCYLHIGFISYTSRISTFTTFYTRLEPHLLKIWCDPKADNFIFHKNLLKDWSSLYLLDCRWYLDYPKDCTVTSKATLCERIEPKFQSIIQASITIRIKASKNKSKRKGKEQVRETKDTNDTRVDYVEVPLHGSILPSGGYIFHEQLTPPHGSLRVLVPLQQKVSLYNKWFH